MNNIKPGSIWKAVRAAKNTNPDTIPVNLTLGGGVLIATHDAANAFSRFNQS